MQLATAGGGVDELGPPPTAPCGTSAEAGTTLCVLPTKSRQRAAALGGQGAAAQRALRAHRVSQTRHPAESRCPTCHAPGGTLPAPCSPQLCRQPAPVRQRGGVAGAGTGGRGARHATTACCTQRMVPGPPWPDARPLCATLPLAGGVQLLWAPGAGQGHQGVRSAPAPARTMAARDAPLGPRPRSHGLAPARLASAAPATAIPFRSAAPTTCLPHP